MQFHSHRQSFAKSQRALISVICSALLLAAGHHAAHGQTDSESTLHLLSLPESISLALENNINLERASLTVQSRETFVDQAKSEYHPDLSFRYSESISHFNSVEGGILEGQGDWSDSTSASLASSLTLYDGGARDAYLKQVQEDLAAASLDFDRQRQTLLRDVVGFYFETLLFQRQYDIQQEELAMRREELERIRVNVDNGIRTRADLLRQQAQVSISERSVAQTYDALVRTQLALKFLLRLPPLANIACVTPQLAINQPESLPEPELEESLARIDLRADLSAQVARIRSAEYTLDITQSGKRPSVSANASLSTAYSSRLSRSFDDQLLIDEPRLGAGISVNIPLFDRRRTELNSLRAQLSLDQEELLHENLLLNARSTLLQAEQGYRTAQIQLAAAQEGLTAAEEALEAERSRYEAGATTLLAVTTLENQRLEAALAVETSRTDLITGRLEIAYQDGTIETFLQQTLQTEI